MEPEKLTPLSTEMRHPWLNPVTVAIPWTHVDAVPLRDLGLAYVTACKMIGGNLANVRLDLSRRAFRWFTASEDFRDRFQITCGREWQGTGREGINSLPEVSRVIARTLGPDVIIGIGAQYGTPTDDVQLSGERDLVKHIITFHVDDD